MLFLLAAKPPSAPAEPSHPAAAAFAAYTGAVEERLARQHSGPATFLAGLNGTGISGRLVRGDILLEHLAEPSAARDLRFPEAMLHHWRGTAFVPGARAADFERLLRDVSAYPTHFAPQVVTARLLTDSGDRLQTTLRLRQDHGVSVVLDTSYVVVFGHTDTRHGYSISHSTRIAEIAAVGTPREHALSSADDHGYLWRLNTYWSWEEREDGLWLQIETVSLSRAIPSGLGWLLRPYVEGVPRDSLEFTVRSAREALNP